MTGGNGSTGDLASAEIYNLNAGGMRLTASLTTSRAHHTATPLPGGSVLVAGGTDGTNIWTSAQFYQFTNVNLGTGTWLNTGSLTTGRAYHTATLLPNGKVLAAGGASPAYLNSAELYNPATGTWTPTGALNTSRDVHTATLLPNGRVLVAGGANGSGYQTSAELYNPATGTWRTTGSLTTARGYHTATLLPSGKVLVAGGYGNGASEPLGSAELYDPATGAWTVANSINDPRYFHTATLLPSGQVLVAGGVGSSNQELGSVELYNPATGNWILIASLNTARDSHTATLLPDGRVLVAEGANGGSLPLSDELYDPATGLWTLSGTGSGRYFHTATLLPGGQVLAVGGIFNSSYLNSAEFFGAGLGFAEAWRPVVNAFPAVLKAGSPVNLSGSGFRGISEASGGGTNDSPTDYPLVQLRRLDNEMDLWLPQDPAQSFSGTAFTSKPLPALPAGYYLVTVFVNGIPSLSDITVAPTPANIAGVLNLLLLD